MSKKSYLTGKEFIKIIVSLLELDEIDNINTMLNSIKWSPKYLEQIFISIYLSNKLNIDTNWSLAKKFIKIIPEDKLKKTFTLICNSEHTEIAFIMLQNESSLDINEFICMLCDDPHKFDNLKLSLNTFSNIDIDKIIEHLSKQHNYSLLFWFYKNNKIKNIDVINELAIIDNFKSIQHFVSFLKNNNDEHLSIDNVDKYNKIFEMLKSFTFRDDFYDENIMNIMCTAIDKYKNDEQNNNIVYLIKMSYDNDIFILINFLLYYEYKRNL